MAANYDMSALRISHIITLSSSLKKSSKFYNEDYENIVRAVNRMTRKELLESIERHKAITNVTESEIKRNCQF